jgi:hypothetical protein
MFFFPRNSSFSLDSGIDWLRQAKTAAKFRATVRSFFVSHRPSFYETAPSKEFGVQNCGTHADLITKTDTLAPVS